MLSIFGSACELSKMSGGGGVMVQGATLRGFPDRLDTEKMHTAAEDIRVKGWKWVETALSFPRGPTQQPAASAFYGRPVWWGAP